MSSCRKFKTLIDLHLDGEADASQTKKLFAHIENCGQCRSRFEEVKSLHHTIKSVSTTEPPKNFRSDVVARINSMPSSSRHSILGSYPAIGWASAAIVMIMVISVAVFLNKPEPVAVATPEIHIVSPMEDAVVEYKYVDISAAFTSANAGYVRVILDGKDVTDITEINEEFIIYTSDALDDGYHKATVQITDNKGTSLTQRSWEFYVLGSESS